MLATDLKFHPRSTSIGTVKALKHGLIHASLPNCALGDICLVSSRSHETIFAQVATVDLHSATLVPIGLPNNIVPGAKITTRRSGLSVEVGDHLLGKVVDALGSPLSEETNPPSTVLTGSSEFIPTHSRRRARPIICSAPAALSRMKITEPFATSVKSIDGLCTLGKGQRIAIMASAGLGKSTLLGMIARNADVDVVVIALVGERGREVREFIDDCLGPGGRARSVTVVSTSDEPPLARQLAAQTATSIAEYFRDCAKNVLLIVDSLTRVARAMRENGLATGEIPVRHGYPNSVYTELPRLLERAGPAANGTITAIYTVLTNTTEDIDPLADEIKSLLDGHLVLTPSIVAMNVRPAVDPINSISRLMRQITRPEHHEAAARVQAALAKAKYERELLRFGADQSAESKALLKFEERVFRFLNQSPNERGEYKETQQEIARLAGEVP